MKAMYLANYFVAGCVAFSLLGWIASLHPMAMKAVLFLLAAIAIAWGLSWLLDYSLIPIHSEGTRSFRLKVEEIQYRQQI
jgi:hypothetical protein